MQTRSLPIDDQERLSAVPRYAESYAAPLAAARCLRLAVAGLSVVSLGLLWLAYASHQQMIQVKPLIVRIDQVGKAEAVRLDDLGYRPQAPEIRYFLIQFVTKHFSRMRATVEESFAGSLYFLEQRLADAAMRSMRDSQVIETLLAGGGEEIEVAVQNVAIEDLRTEPYKATVDFERIYYAASDAREKRRERYLAHIQFIVRDQVPNALIPHNPLGLTITYFRVDQSFAEEGS